MAAYQGHPSWNAWNVSLWISNDEPTYRYAQSCIKRGSGLAGATSLFLERFGGEKTPDGARFTARSVRHALAGLMEE